MLFDIFSLEENDLGYDKPDKYFNSLVQNAIDFLVMSVDELEKSPKYSVIHFYTAIELFLKARLLEEDWPLVISNIKKLKKKDKIEKIRSKFEAGEFFSVGLNECVKRLKNDCGIKIPKKAYDSFDELRKHRNKMVHFYHPGYVEITSLSSIVPEQWTAWYHLHRLIVNEWWEYFHHYEEEIEGLYDLIQGNWKFLKAKYEELLPQINAEKEEGVKFNKCSICGYESSKLEELYGFIYSKTCLVCKVQDNQIHISCPECDTEILIKEMGIGICGECGFKTDFDYLIDKLGPYQDPKEDPVISYCAECEYSEASVIPIGEYEENGFCLNCHSLHESKGQCFYCGELIAGMDLTATSAFGCILCGGSLGADNS